jgi:hypothetical protein
MVAHQQYKAINMGERKNKYQSNADCSLLGVAVTLFEKFHTDFLSEHSGIKASTLRCWKTRGTVSPFVATELCKIEQVKAAGFTREKLRPDILVWYDEVAA